MKQTEQRKQALLIARKLWDMGVNITAIAHGSKIPAYKWGQDQTERQSKTRALGNAYGSIAWGGYTKKDGRVVPPATRVGVVHSNTVGQWRCIDIDAVKHYALPYDTFDDEPTLVKQKVSSTLVEGILADLGLPSHYSWCMPSGSGLGYHIYFICTDSIDGSPLRFGKSKETGVFTFFPNATNTGKFDHIEVRWNSCQTVPHFTSVNDVPGTLPATLPIASVESLLDSVEPPLLPPPPPPPTPPREYKEGESIIDTFNDTYLATDIIEKYRYTKQGSRWLCPHSSSGLPGVVAYDGGKVVYSYHETDPLNDGHSKSAFDCLMILEHNRDFRAAFESAGRMLGMWKDHTSQNTHTRKPMKQNTTNPVNTPQDGAQNATGGEGKRVAQGAPPVNEQSDAPHADDPREGGDGKKPKIYDDILIALGRAGYTDLALDILTQETVAITKDGAHVTVDDGLMALIRTYAREMGYGSKGKAIGQFDDGFTAMAYENRVNAIEDFFSGLPQWDGRDRIAQLANHLTVENDTEITYSDGTKRMLSHAYLRRWLISVPAKALWGLQSAMLVLGHPNQGIGKSSLAKWLCPHGLYRAEKVNLTEKDTEIALSSNLIWEIEELSGFQKASQEALKAFISKTEIKKRLPYGRRDVRMPARCALFGTTNNPAFLNDDTGNRRYMIIEVSHINWSYTDIDHAQLWAQALHLAKQGESALPYDEEKTAQTKHNELYESENGITGVIRAYLDFTGDANDTVTTAQVMLHINDLTKQTVITDRHIQNRSVAKALRAAGATATKTRSGAVYTGVVLRNFPNWTPKETQDTGDDPSHPSQTQHSALESQTTRHT